MIRILAAALVLPALVGGAAGAAPKPSPLPVESAVDVCGGLWITGGELVDASTGVVIWQETSDTFTAIACQGGSEPMVVVGARGVRGEGRIALLKPGAAGGGSWVLAGEIAVRGVPSRLALESGRLAVVLQARRGSSFGVVDATDGAKLQTAAVSQPPSGLGVSPDGERFVLATGSDLRTFRVDDGLTRAIIPFPEPIVALAVQKGVARVLVGQGSAVVAVDPRDKPDRGSLPVRARAVLPRPAKRLVWIDGGRAAGVLIGDPAMLLVLAGNDLSILEVHEQEADAIGSAGVSDLLWVRGGREKKTGVLRLSAPPPELTPYEPAPAPPQASPEPAPESPHSPPAAPPPPLAPPPPPPRAEPSGAKVEPPPAAKTESPPAAKAEPLPAAKAEPPAAAKAEPATGAKTAPPPVVVPPPPSRAEPSGAKAEPPPAVKTEPPPAAKTAPPPVVVPPPPSRAEPSGAEAEPPPAARNEPPTAAATEPSPPTKVEPPPVVAAKPPSAPPRGMPEPRTPPPGTPPPGAPPAPATAQTPSPRPAGAPQGGSIRGTFTGRPGLVEEVVVLGPDSLLKQFARVKVTPAEGSASFTIDHVPPGHYLVTPVGAQGASLSARPSAARIVVTEEAGARADFEILGAL